MNTSVLAGVIGAAWALTYIRLPIRRLREPRDWWRGNWPTLDPYYRDVQRRLSRGKPPPGAFESRMTTLTELIFLTALLAVLAFWLVESV